MFEAKYCDKEGRFIRQEYAGIEEIIYCIRNGFKVIVYDGTHIYTGKFRGCDSGGWIFSTDNGYRKTFPFTFKDYVEII